MTIFDDTRKEMGIENDAVFQSTNNPNEVTVWHDVDDPESGRSLAESEDLRGAMKEERVAGEPTIWFTEPA